MKGPGGKYDDACEEALVRCMAECVVLVVLNGTKGSGFSVSIQKQAVARLSKPLVGVLRSVADQIEKDLSSSSRS